LTPSFFCAHDLPRRSANLIIGTLAENQSARSVKILAGDTIDFQNKISAIGPSRRLKPR
jgi:hypothetical protein